MLKTYVAYVDKHNFKKNIRVNSLIQSLSLTAQSEIVLVEQFNLFNTIFIFIFKSSIYRFCTRMVVEL